MLASVSGAFVAHLLLLVLFLFAPRSELSGSALRREQEATGPREVTVSLSELMERLERDRPEPEEPEPEEVEEPEDDLVLRPPARPFIGTDMNQPEAAAPENARFESDRNTSASARTRPDESRPQEALPTLEGPNPLPSPTLANREYTDGELSEPPAASPDPLMRQDLEGASFPAEPSPAPSPGTGSGAAAPSDLAAADEAREGDASGPSLPPPPTPRLGSPEIEDTPPDPVANPRGGGEENDSEMRETPGREGRDESGETRERSFLDRNAPPDAVSMPDLPDGPDRLAAGSGSGQGGVGEPDPLADGTDSGAMAAGVERETEGESTADGSADTPPESEERAETTAAATDSPPPPAAEKPGTRPADDGLFAKGFSPQERENMINGMLSRQGDNAVDAEATAMGRYKKAVRDAISQTWHRYRQENADFVTWGILKIEFAVDPSGRVRNLRITKNEANAMLAEFSLRAIRDARLPPMPPDVASAVGEKGLVIQYDIIIY